MDTPKSEKLHKLFGPKKTKVVYRDRDFVDYSLMILFSAVIIYFVYGPDNILAIVGLPVCAYMVLVFSRRHGMKICVPLIFRQPVTLVHMLIYKIQNTTPVYYLAIAALLIENYVIYKTPQLPHRTELMHEIALYLFYGHLAVVTIYRTMILVAHLFKMPLIREVLLQSPWKGRIVKQPSITLEVFHAYLTGILTHIVYLAPWYFVLQHFNFSVYLLPITLLVGMCLQIAFTSYLNEWFYRDHWLGHNSEVDFIYNHGPHHDAIPCALIGVAGNGYLEGFWRGVLAFPAAFFNPILTTFFYTFGILADIKLHQYIPGIFPRQNPQFLLKAQHSIHHYGRLAPYGLSARTREPSSVAQGLLLRLLKPESISNSIKLDEDLNGFKWDNSRHRWLLDLFEKYDK